MNFFVSRQYLVKCAISIGVVLSFFIITAQSTHAAVDWSTCRTESGQLQIPNGSYAVNHILETPLQNINKAFVLVSSTGDSDVRKPSRHLVTGHIKDTSTVHFHRESIKGTAYISYNLVECFNNEFTVQHGLAEIPQNATSAKVNISSVNPSRSMVILSSRLGEYSESVSTENEKEKKNITKYSGDADQAGDKTKKQIEKKGDDDDNESSSNQEHFGMVLGQIHTANTLLFKRGQKRKDTAIIRYQVIQFSQESGVHIRSGETALRKKEKDRIVSIDTVDPTRSWVYCSWTSTSGSLVSNAIGCNLTQTAIGVHRYAQTNAYNDVQYYVVQFPEQSVSVQRGIADNNPSFSNTSDRYIHDIPVKATSDGSKAFSYVTNTTRGSGSAYPRHRWLYYVLDKTTIRTTFFHETNSNNDQNRKYWQLMEFPRILTPTRPTIQQVEEESRTPEIIASTFNGSGIHLSSEWTLRTEENCTGGTQVWYSNSELYKQRTTISNSYGTFLGDLKDTNQLAVDTEYYICVRYTNEHDISPWSRPVKVSTNIKPIIDEVIIISDTDSFIINPGNTQPLVTEVSITDTDGCDDIQSINAVFHKTSKGESGEDDPNFRYTMSCSLKSNSCLTGNEEQAVFDCTADVQYYAEPTDELSPNPNDDWTVSVRGIDDGGDSPVVIARIEMVSTVATHATGDIQFSKIGPGRNTRDENQIIDVENIGNMTADIRMAAYGVERGDGYAQLCTTGAIPIKYLKFSLEPFNYANSGEIMFNHLTEVDFDIHKATDETGSSKNIYLGLGIPKKGAKGTCFGTIAVYANPDPHPVD